MISEVRRPFLSYHLQVYKHVRAHIIYKNSVHPKSISNRYANRCFSSSGMNAFMEFEREMALKRRTAQPQTVSVQVLHPPSPPKDDECCNLDCPNCVLLVYQEQLIEYELSQRLLRTKAHRPNPRFHISFVNSPGSRNILQQRQEANERFLYQVLSNNVISSPYKTNNQSWRSVRHLEIAVDKAKHPFLREEASNIAIYVPNDTDQVDRILARLDVHPDAVFTVRPHNLEASQGTRPFDKIASVREALTWTFDLISTPRAKVLRELASYATDPADVEALTAPQALNSIPAVRNGKRFTMADLLDLFPSIQIDFQAFYQIAPINGARYYTVSSSRKLYPETISITLGIKQLDSMPLPRCSSYLSTLNPRQDSVYASFIRSTFVFPHTDQRPIMLISAGTGIAPFRAFLQDLEHEHKRSSAKNHRKAYLFYGCRHPTADLLYKDELLQAHDSGYLDQLHIAYSKEQPKRYVQDLIREQHELVMRHLVEENGYMFICGSLAMGRAVKQEIVNMLVDSGKASTLVCNSIESDPRQVAKKVLSQFLTNGQIVTELW